jgi:uncharacterized membrane protein (UPF0127 family)
MWCRFYFVLAELILGCQRAPPEELTPRPNVPIAPPPATPQLKPVVDTPARAPSGRCVADTPRQPPEAAPPLPATACPVDPERGAAPQRFVTVLFADAPAGTPTGTVVQAELVRSPHDTARGLMYRTNLPEDHGMLFDLGTRENHKFWMHNTCIPLDLLYVDEDGLIVGIVENAPTLNDEARGVTCPSVYVLEVNAGWARRHAVRAGQWVRLPPEVNAKTRP